MKVKRNYVQVVGTIWMPATAAAMEYVLDSYNMRDLEEIADIRHKDYGGSEEITREDVEEWLTMNSGDFQGITDFCAYIDGVEIEWEDFENGFVYNDCMYSDEDEDQ